MVDRSGPGRDVGKDDRPVGVGEELVVAACSLSALLVPLRQMSKFRAQYTCLDGIESAVVPFDVVEVFLRLAVVAEHLAAPRQRSEEHTSELQSLAYLVCRLLLEKKKNKKTNTIA